MLATVYGLLPDRVDLTFVFAAYGAGNVIGTIVAVRTGRDPVLIGTRRGVTLMSIVACVLAPGLLGLLPS